MVGRSLLIFGAGYCGRAIAEAAVAAGFEVTATSRGGARAEARWQVIDFDQAGPAIAKATHILATAPPGETGDPALAAHGAAIAAADRVRWIGYVSTTGVYGDRNGGWVDEATPPAPSGPRGLRRVAAEAGWAAMAGRCAVDLVRVAGIYGPGRSALDDVRAGRSRRVNKPGHVFGRIHRDDITGAVLAAMLQAADRLAERATEPARAGGVRALNLSDDGPASSADVLAEAARLLGVPPPPLVPYAAALAAMSPMARSFWAENRRVSSAATQAALGYRWRFPDYRSGLAAILAEEGSHGPA